MVLGGMRTALLTVIVLTLAACPLEEADHPTKRDPEPAAQPKCPEAEPAGTETGGAVEPEKPAT